MNVDGPAGEEEETQHLPSVMEPYKRHSDRFPQASSVESGLHFFYHLCIFWSDCFPFLCGYSSFRFPERM